MTDFFSEVFSALEDQTFEEIPVDVKTFVEGQDYLNQPPLSDIQYVIVECMSQVYREEDLITLLGEEEGSRHYRKYTKNELILALGKGCHAPYTPIFDPKTGKWVELASSKEGSVATINGTEYSTEPFLEGFGQMLRVKTSLGFVEDVYIGHKYFAMKKHKFYRRKRDSNTGEFLEAANLLPGDRIAIGMNMGPENPVNIPTEHAELIGYWLGDGSLPSNASKRLSIDFAVDELESIDNYLQLCKEIGDEPKRIDHKNKRMVTFYHSYNSAANDLVKKYGLWGLKSKTKFIPDALWASDNSVLLKTIERLWQTDGCIYDKNGGTAEYVSVSKELATGVHRAMLRLGVPASIRSKIPSSDFANASRAYYVSVGSQESYNEFAKKFNLLDHKRPHLINKSGRVYERLDGNIYWDKIVSIESIGEGEYWTRTVPESGHYIGNGMISANSGKDHSSTIGVAYLVYKLLCLKDPARYYGKPSGDAIDIMNVAINAQQAKNVFFKGFKNKIEKSPWFQNKFASRMDYIEFDKSITVYSGHSERESHEGLNLFCAILDEISGFAVESTTGHAFAKTGAAIYKAFRGTVDSRFPDLGKVVLLSFPRFKEDYISQKYKEAVAEKETKIVSHKFKVDESLPDGIEGNEFTIEWEEDHIVSYTMPKVLAIKRPTWEVNPTRKIEDFKNAFYTDPADALQRFACMPPEAESGYFTDHEKISSSFSVAPVVVEGQVLPRKILEPGDLDRKYFMHVDLAQKHDRCALAVAHVDSWSHVSYLNDENYLAPHVVVDFVYWWTPTKNVSVNFTEVKEFIIATSRKGYNLELVTFDRWQSHDMIQELRSVGINSETLSVAKQHYDEFKLALMESRITGPEIEILRKELMQLRLIKNKVDHPRAGGKDLADAVCGAIYNAITLTPPDQLQNIRVIDLSDVKRSTVTKDEPKINPPKREMPPDLQDFMSRMRVI